MVVSDSEPRLVFETVAPSFGLDKTRLLYPTFYKNTPTYVFP